MPKKAPTAPVSLSPKDLAVIAVQSAYEQIKASITGCESLSITPQPATGTDWNEWILTGDSNAVRLFREYLLAAPSVGEALGTPQGVIVHGSIITQSEPIADEKGGTTSSITISHLLTTY